MQAKETSAGIEANLLLMCIDYGKDLTLPPRRYVQVRFSKDMPEGGTMLSWRIDDQPVHRQPMPYLGSTSMSALQELSPDALRRAKRVRLEWTAIKAHQVLFYDFDVTGADKALAVIPCPKK